MNLANAPTAKFGLLIRKPAAVVFEAFVDPDVLTKFWITESSGSLEERAVVRWHFGEQISCEVRVLTFESNQRMHFEWAADGQPATTVEWIFDARTEDTTFVSVECSGFSGDDQAIMAAALDATGGFALVLAAAKAYIEHGVRLNIIQDGA